MAIEPEGDTVQSQSQECSSAWARTPEDRLPRPGESFTGSSTGTGPFTAVVREPHNTDVLLAGRVVLRPESSGVYHGPSMVDFRGLSIEVL